MNETLVAPIYGVICFLLGCWTGWRKGFLSWGVELAQWRGRCEVAETLANSFIEEAKKKGTDLRFGTPEPGGREANKP